MAQKKNELPFLNDVIALRRDIHAHPEICYEEVRTSKLVADELKKYGVDEIVTGLGKTGVVGVIKGKGSSNRGIALRADMDALPMDEITGLPYASKNKGRMHACGHDGHTAMLLGAARQLCQTRNFSGSAVLIFQPAEEGGAGAKAMISDGLFQKFPIGAIYGLHNDPRLPVGVFALRSGPAMAAADRVEITIEGKGTHAAQPQLGIDPIVVGSHLVTALQTIVARAVDPLESAVVSICTFNAGNACNVIPQTVTLWGTARSFKPQIRDLLENQIKTICENVGKAFGARVDVNFMRGYPVLVNEAGASDFAASVASTIAANENIDRNIPPVLGGEDFAYYLEEKPGAFICAGNGPTENCHHPAYDSNDELIPYGVAYWTKIIETALPLSA